jgi:hypothetical protein
MSDKLHKKLKLRHVFSIPSLFVCAGTGDIRHLHLEVLASIARFVEQPEFEYRWMGRLA